MSYRYIWTGDSVTNVTAQEALHLYDALVGNGLTTQAVRPTVVVNGWTHLDFTFDIGTMTIDKAGTAITVTIVVGQYIGVSPLIESWLHLKNMGMTTEPVVEDKAALLATLNTTIATVGGGATKTALQQIAGILALP